ncbi:MAG: CIS tube protein, partial [Candidatus Binatia bacterium]
LEGNVGSAASLAIGGSFGLAAGMVSSAAGAALSAAAGIANAASGNQRRNGFRCIVESVKQKFTLFSPEGIPLRAALTVGLREYKTLDEQLAHLNLTSPDRTHSHVTQISDTLSRIAAQYYRNAGDWRLIADANGIEDPRRLIAGAFLTIPPAQ